MASDKDTTWPQLDLGRQTLSMSGSQRCGFAPSCDDKVGLLVRIWELLAEGAPELVRGGAPRREVLVLLLAQPAPAKGADSVRSRGSYTVPKLSAQLANAAGTVTTAAELGQLDLQT